MAGQPLPPALDPLQAILRLCSEAAPDPWYPRTYAETAGVPRDSLDQPLEQLRLAGLVSLTDWVQGRGQGYVLTPEGVRILENPRLLSRLRDGKLPIAPNGQADEDSPSAEGATTYDRGEAVREALLGPSNPVVTRALIFANVIVFLCGLFLAQRDQEPLNKFLVNSTPAVLSQTGAIKADFIVRGEWWRLLSCCFVHIGLLHLGVNMYSLWAVGPLVEKMWGPARFLAIYLIAGLGGSCAMVISTPRSLGAGASGALWGILTALVAWVVLNRRFLPPQIFGAWLRQLLTVFVLNVFISTMPGISAAAHFGGGAAGLLAAVLLHYQRFSRPLWSTLALAGVVAVPLGSVAAVLYTRNTHPYWKGLEAAYRREQGAREAQDLLGRRYQDAEKMAHRAEEQAGKLLAIDPPGRDPEDDQATGHVLKLLAEAQAALGQAARSVEAAGPYKSAWVEEQRQLVLQYLEARSKLCALAESHLEGKRRLTAEDREAYQEQWRQVGELSQRRWKVLQKEPDDPNQ